MVSKGEYRLPGEKANRTTSQIMTMNYRVVLMGITRAKLAEEIAKGLKNFAEVRAPHSNSAQRTDYIFRG